MTQYIDKNALAAVIRKRLLPAIRDKHYDEWEEGQNSERIAILNIIDTLEVKEVDLEKEVNAYMDNEMKFLSDEVGYDTLSAIARYFFELGIKATQKGE